MSNAQELKGKRRAAVRPAKVLLAHLAIFAERAAPVLTLSIAPLALVAALSLFGVWSHAPQSLHFLILIVAFAASGLLFARERRGKFWPSRDEALARLECDGKVRHDALRAQEDAPFGAAGPLWDAHVAEMRAEAARARLSRPRATANDVDPYRLRYAGLAVLLIGVIVAGDETASRLADGFWPKDPRAAKAGFADLWIEPPRYTGKAPIYLLRAKDALPGLRKQIDAPAGSLVHAQVKSGGNYSLALKTPAGKIKGEREGDEKSSRRTLTLEGSGVLSLSAGGRTGRWPIGVIADEKPSVDFIDAPRADRDGRLMISARTADDYGVVAARLELRLAPEQARALDAPAIATEAKNQIDEIPLDALVGAGGAKSAAIDLLSHRWAGLRVIARLVVTDAAGQEGGSAPETFTLPEKPFVNPLAETVIEQRQSLALAPGEWRRVAWAFNGVTLAPQYFFPKASDYLLLRSAMWRVSGEAGGDYAKTVEDFWPLALQLENETLELSRRRLNAAKEALQQALESGASDEEIARLTEQLRAALQQYLQALAQSGGQPGEEAPPADDVVNSTDLNAMLDSIRDLAQSGAKGAAQQALADLDNLLNNLRVNPRGGGEDQQGQGQQGAAGPAGEAGDLIGRQRELADKTFKRGETRGAKGEDLAEEQGAIAGDLSTLMKSLGEAQQNGGEGNSPDPDGKAGDALSRALSQMGASERALKEGDMDGAGEAMEQAIASLREGAGELARQAGAAKGQGGQQFMRDPLGRPVARGNGADVDVPEKSDAQRARELLLELRRRLSNGERTEEEIKYLERLLERF
ncbi:MAG: TIGR02302 family protein [Parvularculaceae bacterium]